MTDYGVTADGFVKKTLAIILAELSAAVKAQFGDQVNCSSTSIFGQFNGIYGDKLRELWDVAEATYRSYYPSSASGEGLEGVCEITGTTRNGQVKSTVTLDGIYINAACAGIPIGSIVSVGSNGSRFQTTTELTAKADPGTFSVDAESVDYGAIQGYAETIDTIQTPITGWSAAVGLTTPNAEPYTGITTKTLKLKIDGEAEQTVTFATGTTAANVVTDLDAAGIDCEVVGTKVRIYSPTEGTGSSIEITGGTGRTILGFVLGRTKGFNSLDAIPGYLEETDPALRIRRVSMLGLQGEDALDKIISHVLAVDGVADVFGAQNVTNITDANGLPPHSFEIVVYPTAGLEDAIGLAIWNSQPAGIEPWGTTSVTIEDTQGVEHSIGYSVPEEIEIFIIYDIDKNDATFPADGHDQIKEALVTLGDLSTIGEDIIALKFRCEVMKIEGVNDVTEFKIGITNPPTTETNVVMTNREIAMFDTSRIDYRGDL